MVETNRPLHEIRLGRIKACIWDNQTRNGSQLNVTLHRLYRLDEQERGKSDNGWRQSTSFSRDDLLLVAKVCDLVHTWCYEKA